MFIQVIRTGTVKARPLSNIMPWAFFRKLTDDDLKQQAICRDKAFQWLDLAFKHGYPYFKDTREDPDLESIRADPRSIFSRRFFARPNVTELQNPVAGSWKALPWR